MDKTRILEIALDKIKESTECGIESEGKDYGYYVTGVTDIADKLLEELDKKNIVENGEFDESEVDE